MAELGLDPLDDLLQLFNPPIPTSDSLLVSSTSTSYQPTPSNKNTPVEVYCETKRPYNNLLEAAPLKKPVVNMKSRLLLRYTDVLYRVAQVIRLYMLMQMVKS